MGWRALHSAVSGVSLLHSPRQKLWAPLERHQERGQERPPRDPVSRVENPGLGPQ